jgi:hypothetical protein
MYHLVAHALPGTVLFHTWTEGRALWDQLLRSLPGVNILVLMPDHLHLLHAHDVRIPLAAVLSGYIRWRNHERGERGLGIVPLPPAEYLVDDEKIRRSFRYVALNPSRAGLVKDPLSWPLSTYRDSVGLAIDPVRRVHADPHALHAYVSADPSVDARGTALPIVTVGVPTPALVADAVSALIRVPLPDLRQRGRSRSLFLRAAKTLCEPAPRVVAAQAGCSLETVRRARAGLDDEVRLIARVMGDPRFAGLPDGDLRQLPTWSRYRSRR